MNMQRIFSLCARHLLIQKECSYYEGRVKYKSPNGLQSPVGFLIKDEFYDPMLEDFGLNDERVIKALNESGRDVNSSSDVSDIFLLLSLEYVHADVDPSLWLSSLKQIAENFGLRTNAIRYFE